MAQSRQSETQRAGGGASGKNRDQERSGKSGQETGSQQKSGSDGPASASGGKDMMSKVQDQAGTMVEQAREQATTQLSSQKERAASALGTLAGALHEASRQVREQDDAMMAGYIDNAASQVDRLVDTLNQQDLGQIIDSAGRFARRQPAVFLAAAITVGFAGARFLKSSSQASSRGTEWSGYGSYGDRSGSSADSSDTGYAGGLDRGNYGASISGSADSAGYGSSTTGMGSSTSGLGSSTSGIGSSTGGMGSSDIGASDFARTPGSGSATGRDWQARSAFDSGPEGQ